MKKKSIATLTNRYVLNIFSLTDIFFVFFFFILKYYFSFTSLQRIRHDTFDLFCFVSVYVFYEMKLFLFISVKHYWFNGILLMIVRCVGRSRSLEHNTIINHYIEIVGSHTRSIQFRKVIHLCGPVKWWYLSFKGGGDLFLKYTKTQCKKKSWTAL